MSTFDTVVDAVHVVGALRAADRTGVLAVLAGSPGTADEVAGRAGTDPRATRLLLEALRALGLVDGSGDRYRLVAPGVAAAGSLLDTADRLVETVRTGRPSIDVASSDGAGALYPRVVAALSAGQREPAERLADALARPGGPGRSGGSAGSGRPGGLDVLDVAAGGGVYGLALARRDPRARVTALDLPQVLGTTRAAVDAAGLGDRFTYWGADVLTVGDGDEPRFDLAVVANLFHLFDAPTCAEVVRRVAALLRPGGRIAVVDVLPAGPRADPAAARAVALYALGLAGRTSSGGVHDLDAYRQWLAAAGFGPVDVVPLTGGHPLTLLLATAQATDRTPVTA